MSKPPLHNMALHRKKIYRPRRMADLTVNRKSLEFLQKRRFGATLV